jgi:hypothetical protein
MGTETDFRKDRGDIHLLSSLLYGPGFQQLSSHLHSFIRYVEDEMAVDYEGFCARAMIEIIKEFANKPLQTFDKLQRWMNGCNKVHPNSEHYSKATTMLLIMNELESYSYCRFQVDQLDNRMQSMWWAQRNEPIRSRQVRAEQDDQVSSSTDWVDNEDGE